MVGNDQGEDREHQREEGKGETKQQGYPSGWMAYV